MVTSLPMSFRAFTASLVLALSLAAAGLSFSSEPGMVFIPGGEYSRGRAHDHPDSNLPYYPNPLRDDRPVTTIYLDAFYLDEAEVTNARYVEFLKATSHRRPYHWIKGQMPAG